MGKKEYSGLNVRVVEIDEPSIVTASVCEVISVQYYVDPLTPSVCTTEEGEGDPDEGYSYNWNRVPHD